MQSKLISMVWFVDIYGLFSVASGFGSSIEQVTQQLLTFSTLKTVLFNVSSPFYYSLSELFYRFQFISIILGILNFDLVNKYLEPTLLL
jgi:hypothetical protein